MEYNYKTESLNFGGTVVLVHLSSSYLFTHQNNATGKLHYKVTEYPYLIQDVMSVCSDDTDVLVLLPPDLFVVQDDTDAADFSASQVYHLEERVEIIESALEMRRYGSAEPLTPSSHYSTRPRSLQNTPLKCITPHKNLLTSESYLTQKEQDELSLKEIEDYFQNRNGDAEPNVPTLDLPQVNEFISKMEETERDIGVKNSTRSSNGFRRILNFDSPTKKDNFHELSIQTEDSHRDHLVSLNNLWTGVPKTTMYEELKVLRQRLEEERMRRQHCEEIIRDLQKHLLESREKVAVACKVDEDKDTVIKRLREGWSRATEQWKECNVQKEDLNRLLSEERKKFEEEKENLTASLKRHENELLKALDLVHDYKEERQLAVKEKNAMAVDVSAAHDRLRECEEVVDELSKKIKEKDEIIEKNRVRMDELGNLCKDLKKQLKGVQSDKDRLALEKEAKNVVQKKLDEALKREGTLQEQLKNAAKTKGDLKQYYQDQVENLVMEKQKDFQMQLANAEKSLQKQMETKERTLVDEKMQLIEKNKLEVAVLEETHREEIELFKIKITQCHGKIGDLENKLEEQKDRQQELAEKLYAVVQAQWKETLKIISGHCSSEDNSLKPSVLKRQNTFTKDDEDEQLEGKDVKKSGMIRRVGSVTYRVNETPQKIPPQPSIKDYIEQLLQRGGDSGNLRQDCKLDSSLNSVHDASSSSKDKGKSKSPWK